MKKEQYQIGTEFYTGSGKWRCTDVGTRVIVAMKIDPVEVTTISYYGPEDYDFTETKQTLSYEEANIGGYFSGLPYGVAESVFDEYDMEGCYPTKGEAP